MNGVKFIRENGGLGRRQEGTDFISGIIVYGETATDKRLILSISELDKAGVTATTHPVLHYHVSEFFRVNEGAKLYVQSVAESDGNYTEVKVMQNFAEGNIRQIAVCDFKRELNTLSNLVSKLNQIASELGELNIPLSLLLSVKITAEDMTKLPDLHTLNAERVSVVIGQDGGGRGAYLSQTNASISCIGAVLGAVSKAKVSESIAWVEKQNLVSTAYVKALTGGVEKTRELDSICFCDGSAIGNYTPQQLEAINDKGYIFGVKHTGIAGTFLNDSFTATSLESDFAYIENNRTIDKAIRGINKVLIKKVSGPAYIDPDTGLLEASGVAALEALCDDVLDEMKRDGEISGYEAYINPNQQVLRTSKLEVIVKIVPVGTLRKIEVKIGLTLKKD